MRTSPIQNTPGLADSSERESADLFHFEREAWARGVVCVCGIDEAGRGPLAGPVVAAAVVLPRDFRHPELTDSKQLTARQRENIYAELTGHPEIQWHAAFVDAGEIDRINILQATWRAMTAARDGLRPPPDWTLVDGLPVPPLGATQTAIVKGDARSFSIAAASVIAKVARDCRMLEVDREYPGYGFARHKGYGTRQHLDALSRLGACPVHRRSFAPVRLAAAQTHI
ncbi:MAG: ribonuclease HII [Verrucomicrobia bacterium]|nr:ribonuclease HII [Verrucomicrobiota bacterium]